MAETDVQRLKVLEGATFMVSDLTGDVTGPSDSGLFFNDTRFVSSYEVTINDVPWEVLTSSEVDYFSASMFLTNPAFGEVKPHTLSLQRHRFVGGGVHDDIVIHNHNTHPVDLTVRVAFACDFADLFEVKDNNLDKAGTYASKHDPDACELHFSYANPPFSAATRITFTAKGRIEGDAVVFSVHLEEGATWKTCVKFHLHAQERHYSPVRQCEAFATDEHMAELVKSRWETEVPTITSTSETVHDVLQQSVIDLAALRLEAEIEGHRFFLPAAGLPWFMAIFGRDTLITSHQSLWVGADLAKGALHSLATLQGTVVDDFKDEEPGKILHELRFGELSVIGKKPQRPYYGSVDSTMLYLMLLGEYWQMTHDAETCQSLRNTALRALAWMDEYGDADHDGFVEYGTKSKEGLGNQGWKDSWNSVLYHDGRLAELPIALCEVQGYVYAAKRALADIAAEVWQDAQLAAKLRSEAKSLYDAFNDKFWIDRRGGYYAMALDHDKRQVDAMTSNMGQLLWTGIVPEDRAKILVKQLMSDEMFSGWGIRTMSSHDKGYNPIEYHDGTVWPHDNSLICEGLVRYGYHHEAGRIAAALFEAATYTDNRLPETFAGYSRETTKLPVRYPSACSPQAWATGTPFLLVWTLLGVRIDSGTVTMDPHLPEEFGEVVLDGVIIRGQRYRLAAQGTRGTVSILETK